MSTYYLQPDISTWQTQLDPFIATILAYDDNNIRISNKQVYVIYDVTYDNTVPDLENNGQTIFSDKDGRIELHFDRCCRISMDIYMVSEYDSTIDMSQMADPEKYTCYHVCSNLFLPFEPYVTSFEASYISEQLVAVNDEIPRKYVQIYIQKSDNTSARFTIESDAYNDYIINPTIINHIGDNTVTVSWYDSLLDKTWEYDIIVVGKVQETQIDAVYVGIYIDVDGDGIQDRIQEHQINSLVSKSEIIVYLTTFDGYTTSRRALDSDEWEFTTFPQITNINLGLFEIARNDLRCTVRVPFLWENNNYRLDAWYEGTPVKIGEQFVPNDFRIWLWTESGLRFLIPFDQCQIEPNSYQITQEGWNWFTIIYKVNDWTLKDRVAIKGYIEIKYPELDFEMLYFNPLTHSVEDVTEDFDEACTIADRRWFNWERILDRIIDLAKYGKYKLHAPLLTGLSTRCDTDWIITCLYKKAIHATLIKSYIEFEKEDDNNG